METKGEDSHGNPREYPAGGFSYGTGLGGPNFWLMVKQPLCMFPGQTLRAIPNGGLLTLSVTLISRP